MDALLKVTLILAACGATCLFAPVSPARAQATTAPFDDTEAQLRVRQAAGAASAAAREVDSLRKALAAERNRVVQTDGERDLNQATLRSLEQELRTAETRQRVQEAALKAAQEERARGMAIDAERRRPGDTPREQAAPRKPPTPSPTVAAPAPSPPEPASVDQIKQLDAQRDELKKSYDQLLDLYRTTPNEVRPRTR